MTKRRPSLWVDRTAAAQIWEKSEISALQLHAAGCGRAYTDYLKNKQADELKLFPLSAVQAFRSETNSALNDFLHEDAVENFLSNHRDDLNGVVAEEESENGLTGKSQLILPTTRSHLREQLNRHCQIPVSSPGWWKDAAQEDVPWSFLEKAHHMLHSRLFISSVPDSMLIDDKDGLQAFEKTSAWENARYFRESAFPQAGSLTSLIRDRERRAEDTGALGADLSIGAVQIFPLIEKRMTRVYLQVVTDFFSEEACAAQSEECDQQMYDEFYFLAPVTTAIYVIAPRGTDFVEIRPALTPSLNIYAFGVSDGTEPNDDQYLMYDYEVGGTHGSFYREDLEPLWDQYQSQFPDELPK